MFFVKRCELPIQALHRQYKEQGAYVDCYTTVLRGAFAHSQYIEVFYTTPVYKLERAILFLLLAKLSTDSQVRQLAMGEIDKFCAWTVESRAENQLLMCDFASRTRSWLAIALEEWEGDVVTRLYFGSVVMPVRDSGKDKVVLGLPMRMLLPFHKLYSVVLLAAARYQLKKLGWRRSISF